MFDIWHADNNNGLPFCGRTDFEKGLLIDPRIIAGVTANSEGFPNEYDSVPVCWECWSIVA